MAKPKNLTCINCPLGCVLTVELGQDGSIASVAGNACARGRTYAEKELTSPLRTFTTTVRIDGAAIVMLPVKTALPIPKGMVETAAAALAAVRAAAPVHAGDVIVPNLCGTGVDLVATRTLPRQTGTEELSECEHAVVQPA